MRYLLNSAVITTPGGYEYRLISVDQARTWFEDGPTPISTIGYTETAEALSVMLQQPIRTDRRTIRMQPGDEALVFRIVLPPGAPRIAPGDKGRILDEIVADHVEIGILRRLS